MYSKGATKMSNVISLIRVSTKLQSEGTGLEFQSEKIKQYSELNDFNIIKTISDVCSGGLETRDGIEELKSEIEKGGVDCVLIWNVSRAFRSMVHFSKFYEYLNKHNVELISVSEGIRSSSKTGAMMFGVMVSIAQYEKDLIAERMSSGRLTKVQNGTRAFGKKIYGYTTDYKIDPDEAKVVKYIFKKINSLKKKNYPKYKQTKHLLKLLKQNGYTYNGHDFKNYNMRDILKQKFYTGVLQYSDITTTHNYQPLVSKRLFNQVQ